MRDSPRIRRLRTDHKALARLRSESSILDFSVLNAGTPPDEYRVSFRGKGLWRREGTQEVLIRDEHEVRIRLGAAYPRMMPELAWKTPIFHPNISASGVVCLGGYGLHWVPSLNLDDLCIMLWDMIRYENYDIKSAYNREAAIWARDQGTYCLPVDPRPLRDKVAAGVAPPDDGRKPPILASPPGVSSAKVLFRDDQEIVEAEIVEPEDSGILYIS